jgi:cell division protein FtsB
MAPTDPTTASVLRELAQLRDETARARAETKGVRDEVRIGLERLSGTWAADAKERHDLTGAIKTLAETTTKHATDLSALKTRQEEDDHEKTRAKTAITIFRVAGGFLLTVLISLGGYLLRSYIEVRDQTRDHSAALATMREREDRLEREHTETETDVRESQGAIVEVRTRLTNIDGTLGRIEEGLERRPRR